MKYNIGGVSTLERRQLSAILQDVAFAFTTISKNTPMGDKLKSFLEEEGIGVFESCNI